MPSKKKPSRPPPPSPFPRTPSPTPSKSSPPTDEDSLHYLLSSSSARHSYLISTTTVCPTRTSPPPTVTTPPSGSSIPSSPPLSSPTALCLRLPILSQPPLSSPTALCLRLPILSQPLRFARQQCAKRFGIDLDHTHVAASSGSYFAIATVYASSKVPKNGARLSWGLNENPLLPRYKGVLLYSPPGTGKTSLVSFCVLDVGANLFSINGPEIVSQYYGESEQTLYKVFVLASRAAPDVVFIDELDAIAPARKDGGEELSLRLVATLLKLMDEISRDDGRVLVIAATNRSDSIDRALRWHGRLDREIEIGVPFPDQRLDILQTILSGIDNSLSNTEIHSLAMATHGFVGADLAALCNEAAMTNLRSNIKLKNSGKRSKEPCPKTNGLTADLQGFDVHKDEYASSGEHMDSLLSSLSELCHQSLFPLLT